MNENKQNKPNNVKYRCYEKVNGELQWFREGTLKGFKHIPELDREITLPEGRLEMAPKTDVIEQLRTQLAAAQEENDALRRIHKENTEILVKELAIRTMNITRKLIV